jgi:hypothetical protein
MGLAVGAKLSAGAPIESPDQAQIRTMMPTITAYLQSGAYRYSNGEYSAAAYRALRVRWLCNAAIFYVHPDGTRWRVGMDVWCGDYDRRGNKVISEDGGDMGYEVMILSGAHRHYRVLTTAQEPGVSPDPAWIERNFPAAIAAAINSGRGLMASMPDRRALRALDCTTMSTHASVFSEGQSGFALGWRCMPPTS